MKKRILVLGANGLIGSSIVNFLSGKNFKITGVYNKEKSRLKNNKNVNSVKCNLLKLESVKKKIKNDKFDIIINSAAILKSNSKDYRSIIKLYDYNVNIQKNLLATISKKKRSIFIFFSSISIYEDINKKTQINEFHNYNLNNMYALSKICGENLLEAATISSNIFGISLRLSGVHGEGRNNGVIYNMFKNATNNEFVKINEPKSVFRLTFLDDINKAIYLIINKKLKTKYSFYNLASEDIYSLKKLADNVIKICKKGKLKLLSNSKIRYQVLNINKFKKDYKYKSTPLLKKLKKYNEYYKSLKNLEVNK